MTTTSPELIDFFKALADETRLKIVGVLANEPRSVDELAAMLALSAPTISHHLGRLQAAGLVTARAEQHYHVYALRLDVLQRTARSLAATETLREAAAAVDVDAYARGVLHNFVERGRLKEIPSQLKKKQVVIRWLADLFEPGKRYTEKQVNDLLRARHEDFATLRRELINMRYLDRRDGLYWRRETEEAAA
jgi:DNA-binding HxlR family transcriptional regulator